MACSSWSNGSIKTSKSPSKTWAIWWLVMLILLSVILDWGNLLVLIFCYLSPVPTWDFRLALISSLCFLISLSHSLDLKISRACNLFCNWDLSFWHWTTIPEGSWVILIAVATLLTFWPPAPPKWKTSIFISFSFISTSISYALGKTATVIVDVWILPWDSVEGTLWTLWTPLSKCNLW